MTVELEHELQALATGYALGVDQRHRARFLGVFHPDAVLEVYASPAGGVEPSGVMRGHAEIGSVIDKISVYPKTFHFIGQSSYEVTARSTTGEVYCVAHHLRRVEEGWRDLVMFIRYEDVYHPGSDGSWRIAHRSVRVEWTEDHEAQDWSA